MSDIPDSSRQPANESRATDHQPVVRRKQIARQLRLDRALEALPLFRLSDSSDETSLSYSTPDGGRWRVLPYPGDRLPGTFDQDVYVEILRRYHDAGAPDDGAITFTLHSFLRSMGRRADGRTYAQLRSTLARLEHTVLESASAYYDANSGTYVDGRFTLLSSVRIDRRRVSDRTQFSLFSALASAEPGIARLVVAPALRSNIGAGHITTISISHYGSLQSPVARRLYRLLEAVRSTDQRDWKANILVLAQMLPLTQRYPSHILRVLHPAHEMLIAAGLLRSATAEQAEDGWAVTYVFEPS